MAIYFKVVFVSSAILMVRIAETMFRGEGEVEL